MSLPYHDEIQKLKQYKMILDHNSIVSKTDVNGIITYVNDKFCEASGYSKDELIGKNHRIIKHPDNPEHIYQHMWDTIKNKKIWQGTLKNRKKNGEAYYVKSTIAPILNSYDKIIEYIAARIDVTDLVHKDEIIKNQFMDELTGLQNRTALLHDLKLNGENKASLVLINIDRFSDINDYFGYEVGDEVLKSFSQTLLQAHKKVYRISGDEFAILCEHTLNNTTKQAITAILDTLQNSSYSFEGMNISLFLSCGVSYGKKKDIYKFSHIALKDNKRTNKKVTFFNENPDLQNRIKENLEIITKIKNAIDNDRFVPYYQGIVDNKTQEIVKYEALIRLQEKDGKIISPVFFLEHAKKAKLYTQLTKIMLEKVFQKFADSACSFAINFTLEDIESQEVVQTLVENLQKYACGERVTVEIVESEGIENFDEVSNFIKKVKMYGCKIAIDDFGTGYSNFSYLGKLDIDFIKIDGSLVLNMHQGGAEMATLESILHFAKKMQIKTIAEFVKDEETYETLHQMGVDYSQGYYFCKPQENLRD
ncbi:sensor domain-containing protein [Sulfurimonas hydrogeniphila]|uniref:sensor domain-containing protein n=1 Tax=Sulfurimonas hydrogeniphila TaxID=2509341 RepID=UPI00125F0A3F|nr:GGDEF domain-containing phosphodiesterase [Sulfurimonas hydrogeniphila]